MSSDNEPDDLPMPLPLEIVSDEDAANAFFPSGGPDPTTPIGCAFLWWKALLQLDEYRTAIENLSINPDDWDGYQGAKEDLNEWALMQNIVKSPDAPEKLAYAKFMQDTGWSMKAFDDAALDDYYILTMALCPDGWWRVWGLSRKYTPPASQVFTGE
jgi:hypothetical protein